MPLDGNSGLVDNQHIPHQRHTVTAPASDSNHLVVMKSKSRTLNTGPIDLKHQKSNDSFVEPPRLVIDNAEPSSNMAHINGSFRDPSPSPQEAPRPGRVISASMMRSAALSASDSPASAEPTWSAAIGHASTGKSGRVIERLQGEIDKMRRENQLIKVQFEEAEKANETLATRCQYLQDRNSNYEASHEANIRQLERKERQMQDLREELRREREKTARAEERATLAATHEETWREEADQAKAVAQQRETEYETIVACRNADNARYQGGLDKAKVNFGTLLQQREEDNEKYKKWQILTEQQQQTIQHTEQLNQKLNSNFRTYRSVIDTAIEELRRNAESNDTAVSDKLREMQEVIGQMKWVMNVEQVVNHTQVPPRPTSKPDGDRTAPQSRDGVPMSPSRKQQEHTDSRNKTKNRWSKSMKS